MVESSGKRSASSIVPHRSNKKSKIVKYLVLPVIAPLVVSLIVTSLNKPPSITASTAHTFLADYFNEALHASQRRAVYQNDLTANFRSYPGNDWTSYVAYWEESKSVSLNSVLPVPGNSLEFDATLTYQITQGRTAVEDMTFWLVCNGFTANLWARMPYTGGCPAGGIKIDNEQIYVPPQ